jgi:hypothetical protein
LSSDLGRQAAEGSQRMPESVHGGTTLDQEWDQTGTRLRPKITSCSIARTHERTGRGGPASDGIGYADRDNLWDRRGNEIESVPNATQGVAAQRYVRPRGPERRPHARPSASGLLFCHGDDIPNRLPPAQ